MSAGSALARPRPAEHRVELEIRAVDPGGCGVAELDGAPVEVDGALEGERVIAELGRRRRRATVARLVRVSSPSPHRVPPSCSHFEACGGCRFQHLSVDAQRRNKERVLMEALAREGVGAPRRRLEPLTGAVRGYRRKARLGVKYVAGKGGALVGFRERRGNFIADMRQCEVLVPAVGARIEALRRLVSGLDARDRVPQIEVAAGDAAVALVFRHLDPLSAPDREALRRFARESGLHVYVQPGGVDTITPLEPRAPAPLRYRIPEFDLVLEFKPAHFIQVNAEVNRALVSLAVSLLEPDADDRVLDLYCGIGNFSLALARRAGRVTGVEASAEMVAAAGRNAASNGLVNVRFEAADLEDPTQVAAVLEAPASALMLDPPRTGAKTLLAGLGPPYPARIVYISCNPQSFAEDARVLVNRHGYGFDAAGIVDMFPHTGHVEVIGRFSTRAA